MEKINVAELLKNCPQGMELDCSMYENCTFEAVFDYCLYPIQIKTPVGLITLNKYGSISKNKYSKCIIFPKGKTTWEGFVPPCKFKDGDIISDSIGICIFKGEGKIKGTVDYYCGILFQDFNVKNFNIKNDNQHPNCHYGYIANYKFATEEEKEKLFQVIKDNGYRWDDKTKTLEKLTKSYKEEADDKTIFDYNAQCCDITNNLIKEENKTLEEVIEPRFRVGNRIRLKSKHNCIYTVFCLTWDNEKLAYKLLPDNNKHLILVSVNRQDEYELAPNKFDITTLIPFESKVLVRDNDIERWRPTFWGFYDNDDSLNYPYECVGSAFAQCIPYEGNEHLRGTNNKCNDFYKTW